MNVTIARHAYLPQVTLGHLYAGDLKLCTLEEPWIRNPNGLGGARRADGHESCVPDGEYTLKPHDGTRFKNVYRLSNPALGVFDFPDEVHATSWGRAAVLIHNGNTTADIIGCIVVGLEHGFIDGEYAVLRSREALDKLRAVLLRVHHTLTIKPAGAA